MRILLGHNRYKNVGGETFAVGAEIELLKSHGHVVDLLDADNADIVGLASEMKTAIGAPYSSLMKRRMTARIAEFKPDVVHVHNFFPLLSPSIHYASSEAGIPVVQTLHNYRLICPGALLFRSGRPCEDCIGKEFAWPSVLHGCYRGSRLGTASVAVMSTTHRWLGTWRNQVDCFVALTEFSRRKLVDGGLPAEKVVVKPNFAPDPGCLHDRNRHFAFFAGRLSAEKGIMTALSAWDCLKNGILLKIAGDGPLRAEVTRRAAQENIEYLGVLPRMQIQNLMSEASFLIFPSICYENFPLSVVEALASGLPVVASGIGAMTEIIDNGRTGLHFRAGDADDLARKVEWLIRHPQELARMRDEARAEYLSKYTPERNYRLMIGLYEQAISKRQCRRI